MAAVKSGISISDAKNKFGIPKSTICDNFAGDHGSLMGQPLEQNKVKESMLEEIMKLLADWGFLLTSVDLATLSSQFKCEVYPMFTSLKIKKNAKQPKFGIQD
jgi:hypothetical protein